MFDQLFTGGLGLLWPWLCGALGVAAAATFVFLVTFGVISLWEEIDRTSQEKRTVYSAAVILLMLTLCGAVMSCLAMYHGYVAHKAAAETPALSLPTTVDREGTLPT